MTSTMTADGMDWTTLVDAAALAAHLGDPGLRIVDARFVLMGADPGAGERAWRASHIPGAAYADLDRDLSDHRKPASEGRHPLPEAADFCASLVRWGITPAHQVVVYDAGDAAMAASRLWWLLRLLGHRRVAVLDGGFGQWVKQALPLESTPPDIAPGAYDGQFDQAAIAEAGAVAGFLERGGKLIDVRAGERFRGDVEPLDARAGHIPGAQNRPYLDNLAEGRFLPVEQLRAGFLALIGDTPPSAVIFNCGSGVTACQGLLAMEHAGLSGARVYAGSWSGWISDPARPIATGAD